MRKLLSLAIVALLAVPSVAHAGKILRQNADGTASWVNTRDDTATPAGEHQFTFTIPAVATASTHMVVVPFAGRLKSIHAVNQGELLTATMQIEVLVGGSTSDQFTPVTPAIAEAASGSYELSIPLVSAGTGQVTTLTWPVNSNTSLDFSANAAIAITHDARSTAPTGGTQDDDVVVTIVVH